MEKQTSVWKGILAGMAGGLVAAWVMNVSTARVQSDEPIPETGSARKEDATMRVHYAFGVLSGGLYGGLAEYSTTVTSGFGTSFGGALFSGADLLAIPALKLAPSPMVYGATTELVRRVVRRLL